MRKIHLFAAPLISAFTLLAPTAIHAQERLARPAEIQRFLRDNPELTKGVTTPEGVHIKALKAIPGGIRYSVKDSEFANEVIVEVTGPIQTISKGLGSQLWGAVKGIAQTAGKLLKAVTGVGGGGGGGTKSCTVVVNNSGPGTVIVNNANSCH